MEEICIFSKNKKYILIKKNKKSSNEKYVYLEYKLFYSKTISILIIQNKQIIVLKIVPPG
jgi:hypothetical protein